MLRNTAFQISLLAIQSASIPRDILSILQIYLLQYCLIGEEHHKAFPEGSGLISRGCSRFRSFRVSTHEGNFPRGMKRQAWRGKLLFTHSIIAQFYYRNIAAGRGARRFDSICFVFP